MTIFSFQSEHVLNPINIITYIFLLVWSFISIGVVCELGERMTREFDKLNDTFYQCDWYLFSNEMQRMILMVLINSKRPVIIKGFGNTLCARKSVKKVISCNFY